MWQHCGIMLKKCKFVGEFIMKRIYFDLGVFTYWSEDSLDNRRLISKSGIIISDESAVNEVKEHEEVDQDIVEILQSLHEQGFNLNICDSASVDEIKQVIKHYEISGYFDQIVSTTKVSAMAKTLTKLRAKDDFFIFVGTNEVCVDAMAMCQIPVVAYGEKMPEILPKAFCKATYPLEIEDQVLTCHVIHSLAKKAIETKAKIMGIDGIDFAGKKVFASKLGQYLEMLGKEYQIVHLEDYHRAVEESYKGEDPVEAFYFNGFNNDKLIDEVLNPYKKNGSIDKIVYCLDNSGEAFVNERHYQLSQDGLMIIIGCMMYREPLIRFFDMTVFMKVDYRESEHRASLVEAPIYGIDPVELYRTKNIPAQKMYVQRHDPYENRDFVVDNSNFHRPLLVE